MDPGFGYVFPAIRGIQAGREFYVSMCPLRLLNKLFSYDEEEVRPEMRAQRTLNKARIPEMARYMTKNAKGYVFSAITASVDGTLKFDPADESAEGRKIGSLHVSLDARFIINDGQHRRAAIKTALEERPDLGDETIAVVLFVDRGLKRSQQMFADLNRHAVRPSKSLGVLFDHRDEMAQMIRLAILNSEFFRDIVELERSSLSKGSRKLVTLSSLYGGTMALFDGVEIGSQDDGVKLAREFWESVARNIPEWRMVQERKMAARGVREDFIHSHGTVIHSIGYVGNALLKRDPKTWKRSLAKIKTIDWARSNHRLWEGRAMTGGRVQKARNNVVLTVNAIKRHIGLPLSPEEQRVEDAFMGMKNVG
ncbi:MAG: DNA sulfur modification protein DndB [Krumholzibacteria bacterium]|nr:DNA sulfur modification protein DndB [Candidatus Krumholzibacteria bacterium]